MIFGNSFVWEMSNLFGGMSALAAVLLALGLILIITEFYRPMNGIGYGCGGAVTACGVAVRMLTQSTAGTLFLLLFFITAILLCAHLLMIALHKREWLLVSSGIADDEPESDDEYAYLIGLRGVTTTPVAPSGHMSINDINFYVTGESEIGVGVEVEVRQVSGAKIIVAPVKEESTENDTDLSDPH